VSLPYLSVQCLVWSSVSVRVLPSWHRTLPVRSNEQDNLTGTELREASAKHHRCRDVAMPVCSTNYDNEHCRKQLDVAVGRIKRCAVHKAVQDAVSPSDSL
jgi:hypothetical protein